MFGVVFLLSFLGPAAPWIYTPCEVASEILQNTATLIRCSPEDVARLVCIASLHNYDTSYSFKINGSEKAVGIFGIPPEFTNNCTDEGKSKSIRENVDCLISSQIERNRDNLTHPFLSEYLCLNANMYTNDSLVFKMWRNGTLPDNAHVKCQHSGLEYLYYTIEALRIGYSPQVMDWGLFGVNEGEDISKRSCRKMAFCRTDCSGGKRLLNQQGRQIFDQSLMFASIIAFLVAY